MARVRGRITERGQEQAGAAESRGRRALPYAGAALVALCAFAPVLPVLTERYMGSAQTDMNLQYRHFIAFATGWMRQGVIPLWNPHTFCGGPFMLNTSTTLLSPVSAPFLLLLPQPLSINLVIVLHAVLLSVGTVWWGRVRGLSPLSAFLAGAVAATCSALPCRVLAGHFTIVTTLAWFPVLVAVQELMIGGRIRSFVPLGVVAGMAFLGGHLQFVYYFALLLGVPLLVHGGNYLRHRSGPAYWQLVLSHLAAGGLAFGLVAIEVLPVLDILSYSARGGEKAADWIRYFSMPPEGFLSLIAPHYLGSGVEYVGRWYWWETTAYLGVPALVLCAGGIAASVANRAARGLVVVLAAAGVFSVAGYMPVVSDGMWHLPGWAVFRGHAKILAPALIMAAVLAGHGLDALRTAGGGGAARGTALGAAIAILVACVFAWAVATPDFMRWFMTRADRMLAIDYGSPAVIELAVKAWRGSFGAAIGWGILTVAGLLYLRRSGQGHGPWIMAAVAIAAPVTFTLPLLATTFAAAPEAEAEAMVAFLKERDERARIDFMRAGEYAQGMTVGYEIVGGHDISVTTYFDTLAWAILGQPKSEPKLNFWVTEDVPLLDAANLKYYVTKAAVKPEAAQEAGLREAGQAAGATIYERTSALPRAYSVKHVEWFEGTEQELTARLATRSSYGDTVVLSGEAPTGSSKTAPGEAAVGASARHFGLHEVRVKAPESGWLVLSEGYSPRWKATVAGQAAPVYRANGAFRAVEAKAGQEVVFRYRPWAFVAGSIVSVMSLLGVSVYGLWAVRGRWRPREAV